MGGKGLWDNFNPKNLCFAEGTLVDTPDGKIKIENIKQGDIVWAYDFENNEVVKREVLEIFENFTYYWVDIVANENSVSATRGHEFWVESENEWIEASDLEVGMLIRFGDNCIAPVESVTIRALEKPEATFNFIVDGEHNYYVGNGGILVHNGYPESPKYPPPTKVGENFQFNFDTSEDLDLSRRAGVRRAKAAGLVPKSEIGHHTNSVSSHPHLAAEPHNIIGTKTTRSHLGLHDGAFQNPTSGALRKPCP